MAARTAHRATYEDLIRVPATFVAELIDGELYVSPRPRMGHGRIAARITGLLQPPFDFGDGGPGGWLILPEPELKFDEDALVPDIGGWRKERAPQDEDVVRIEIPPDWLCEIVSPSSWLYDRQTKMPKYAAFGVQYAWIVDRRTIEVYRATDRGWTQTGTFREGDRMRAEPLDAIEIDVSRIFE